jgi:hypothetical protein
MKGIHLEETDDTSGSIHAYDFATGDYLDYNVDVPAAGTYYLFLRYSQASDSRLALQTENGNATLLEMELLPSGTGWTTAKYTLDLNAGKQNIRLACRSASNIRFNWMRIDSDENAETTAIREVDRTKISIYPDPDGKLLYINGIDGKEQLRIVDISGRTLVTEQTTGSVDISSLEKGVYLLSVGQATMKFLKQ